MRDASPGEPRFGESQENATRQVAASDWNRAELEAMPAPARPRERLFSRKVMIGWALFAIAAYFGVQAATSAVKASVRQAVQTGTLRSATHTKDGIVIETPNGTRVTIRRDGPGGPSVMVDDHPGVTPTKRSTPTATTTPAKVTTPTRPIAKTMPTAPPEAPPPIPPEPKKR